MDFMTSDRHQSRSLLVSKHEVPLSISALQLLHAFLSTSQRGRASPLQFIVCLISVLARTYALPQASATADKIQDQVHRQLHRVRLPYPLVLSPLRVSNSKDVFKHFFSKLSLFNNVEHLAFLHCGKTQASTLHFAFLLPFCSSSFSCR